MHKTFQISGTRIFPEKLYIGVYLILLEVLVYLLPAIILHENSKKKRKCH